MVDSGIYESILEDIKGGVLCLRLDGRITIFNRAASRMLDVPRDVVGRTFADVFVAHERLTDFNECIFDAIYQDGVRHQRVVEVSSGAETRAIAVDTSFLQGTTGSGEARREGVIALLSDVTEVRRLREAERELAESVRAQHMELQAAHVKIQDANEVLSRALRKGRWVAVAIIGVVSLAGLAGIEGGLFAGGDEPLPARIEVDQDDVRTMEVTPRRLRVTVSVPGQLVAGQTVTVTSPVAGQVRDPAFEFGDTVVAGQRLLDLYAAEAYEQHRDAEANHIKALRRYNELENWHNGIEVARARRAVNRAKVELRNRERDLDEAVFLLDKGLIPQSEHEAAVQRHDNQQVDYELAESDLETVLAGGSAEELRLAGLELETARGRLQAAELLLEQTVVTAPIDGVILPARTPTSAGTVLARAFPSGWPVTQGAPIAVIDDLATLMVLGHVGEADVVNINAEQQVAVTGEAFHDLQLRGVVSYVSPKATRTPGRRSPTFEVRVLLEGIGSAERRRLRPGMSADLEVVVRDEPEALLVPIEAVQVRGGRTWLRIRNRDTDDIGEVPVEVGRTTLREIEIVSGVEAGSEIVLPST